MKNSIKTLNGLMLGFFLFSATLVSPLFAQKAMNLSDAEIASVAVVANQNDIDFAEIAKQKSNNAEVLRFAAMMAADHKAVIDMAVNLVTELGVTPKDNAVSQQMLKDARITREILMSKTGSDFDKTYIDNEVVYHQGVIEAVEDVLIPQAKNQELKQLLQKVVPILEAHLEHAKMVQKNFKQ